ncbi:hypothetical protein GR223_23670 [Rhizobium leguminosarum]|uniref:hypothetical protein n=1 Tax=Rhizobium ruizarguesonis TaxID=2081791 RepID=UPI0013E0B904|nr:hypothetical protein [Rhizobium ruizarguesonis]NEJ88894.1 hypothetical protein [Rhizobium ruizarguesonis]
MIDELEGRSECLYFHFDVRDHYLKLETFIQTADSARKVIASLNETFFQKSLRYELIVLPPDEGSFLTKLAIWISAGTAGVFGFLNSDIGAAYVDGLTGKPPVEWAKELGQASRELAKAASDGPAEEKAERSRAACLVSAKIVVAMTKSVLENDTAKLKKVGMEMGTLADALDARADFYAACVGDKDVARVGFSPDDDFPIPRSSFAERAQKPARKAEEDEPPNWTVSIENIFVTSPNWDEIDQRARHWKGKDQYHRDCYFVIDDAEFWHLVKKKDLQVDVLDNLKVQWASQMIDGRPKNRRVIRVLEYNGNKLSEPLKADALDAILGRHTATTARSGEPSLFDGLD